VKKLTGGFDNGLGAVLIGEHSLASFLSKKSREGISGLFQQYRSKPVGYTVTATSAFASCGQGVECPWFGDGPCVDGSGLARVFFTLAAVVGAAMCSAC
jgi:hypothetical protein